MNQDITGFQISSDNDTRTIETAQLLQLLEPARSAGALCRAGCESWSCSWSADNAYFAWSCGNNIVKLIPWNRQKHCMLSYSNSDDDLDRELDENQEITINAGQLVWAVAFGSCVPQTHPRSTNLNWSRRVYDSILATGLQNGCIKIWRVKSGLLLHEFSGHTDVVRDLQFSPDGSLQLASASRDGTLRLWTLNNNMSCSEKNSRILHGTESKWLYACCWSPDAHTIATVGKSGVVTLWDMVANKVLRYLAGHQLDVCGCDFSPDGALLVTSSYDASVIVWDPYVGTMLMRLSPQTSLENNESYIRSVSYSHDGRHLASVSDDGFVRFYDIHNARVPCQTATVTNALCCRYSPDGTVLAVGTRNGSTTLWLAPMQVPTLQNISRLAIRRVLSTSDIDRLSLPNRLKRFLRYEVHWYQ